LRSGFFQYFYFTW